MFASLLLDDKEFKQRLEEDEAFAEEATGKMNKAVGVAGGVIKGLEVTAKGVGVAVGAATTAIVPLVKSAVDAYGEQEQLVGGVETLFMESADKVKEYADEAYKTAGMSANQYMETVTSFSASLIQSTGRGEQQDIDALEANLEQKLKDTKRELEDEYAARKEALNAEIALTKDKTAKEELKKKRDEELKDLKRSNEDKLAAMKQANKEQIEAAEAANSASVTTAESLDRAAELANQAIIDMSDNANKMGTSMESIQNAYNGFAKQNYTMLDNLKLGYGGTKAEMERLLADAEAISGVEYDVSSYADIVEAIHIIQTEMGITGTTSKEASGTITGSFGAMKAAWENMIAALGSGDENKLTESLNSLIDSALGAVGNLLPIIENALRGIASAVATLAPIIAEKLPELMNELLPPLIEAVTSLIVGLVDALPSILAILLEYAPSIINQLITAILGVLPEIIQLGVDVIIALVYGIAEALPTLIPAITEALVQIVTVLTDPENLMMLIDAAIQLIIALANGLIQAIPVLLEYLPTIILNVVQALIALAPQLIKSGLELVVQLALGIAHGAVKVVEAIVNLITTAKEKFMERVHDAANWGKDLIDNFIGGIKAKWDALKETVGNIAQTVKDFLGFSEPKTGPLSNFHTYAPDMMNLFMKGIKDNEGKLQAQLSETFSFQPSLMDLASVGTTDLNKSMATGLQAQNASNNGAVGATNVTVVLSEKAGRFLEVVREENDAFIKSNGYSAFSMV